MSIFDIVFVIGLFSFVYCLLRLGGNKQTVESANEAEKKAFDRASAKWALENKQTVLGSRLFNRLKEETKKSQAHFLNGKPAEGLGQMQVGFIAENGDLGFSVFAWVPDSRRIDGKLNVLQSDVCLTGEKPYFHVFFGPYGPERDFGTFEDLEYEAARHLQNFRIFST